MLAWFWLECLYSQTWSHSVLRLSKNRIETSCSWIARGQKMKRICARGNCMGKCRVEKHMECFGNDEFLTDRTMGADVKQKKKKIIFLNILQICRVLCWKRIREKLDIITLQWNSSHNFSLKYPMTLQKRIKNH